MQHIYYELSILSRAVHFKNLSASALHVGLSQPQLSRIIGKIEEELKIVLLDRTAKRKSGWTQIAFQLADLFEKSAKKLQTDMNHLSHNQMVETLKIGTLEGLSHFATKTASHCFSKIGVTKINLEIYDLNELEAHFLSGHLDLILTSKSPGKQKYKYHHEIGFQVLEKIQTNKNTAILSNFEFGRTKKKDLQSYQHILVSNSLSIRKNWLLEYGGTGYLPTELKKGKTKEHEPVLIIGSEVLNPLLWQQILFFYAQENF